MRYLSKKKKISSVFFIFFLIFYFTYNMFHADSKNYPSNRLKSMIKNNVLANNNTYILNKLLITKNFKTPVQINSKNSFQKHRNKVKFLVFDNGGFGLKSGEIKNCTDDIELEITQSVNELDKADIVMFHMEVFQTRTMFPDKKSQYKMVFSMESEVNYLFLTK
jgi:hypothetical protein